MASSIEGRVPFLDHSLAEFLFSLPPEFKIRGNLGKYIHRKAMEGIVPQAVLNRQDKTGYLGPGEKFWMKKEMRNYTEGILYGKDFENRDFYNVKLIRKKYQDMLRGKTGDEQQLWNITALETWFNSH
jgi:asparagine synthase (glutamine-hydrolysing)